jgi:hypothetical protein
MIYFEVVRYHRFHYSQCILHCNTYLRISIIEASCTFCQVDVVFLTSVYSSSIHETGRIVADVTVLSVVLPTSETSIGQYGVLVIT